VATTGLLSNPAYGNSIALLKQAKALGARIDVVNLMTMNYGGAISDMGSAATTAAAKSLTQIKAIWPKDTYKNIGITPMIGQNDVAGENFRWADSQAVLAFAQAPLDYTDGFLDTTPQT
jgi:hypothetical protein